MSNCEICGEPMPEGEIMFKFHGYSGPCPKPPLPKETQPRVPSDPSAEFFPVDMDHAADEIETLRDRLSFAEFEWNRATDGMKERDAQIEGLRSQLASVREGCAVICDKHAEWAEQKIEDGDDPASRTSQMWACMSNTANDLAEMIRKDLPPMSTSMPSTTPGAASGEGTTSAPGGSARRNPTALTETESLRSQLARAHDACLTLCGNHSFATGHGDTVADIIGEIDGQIAKPSWRPIETAPKDRFIIVYCPEDNSRWLAKWQGGEWYGSDCEHGIRRTGHSLNDPDYVTGWFVSHWRDVPTFALSDEVGKP